MTWLLATFLMGAETSRRAGTLSDAAGYLLMGLSGGVSLLTVLPLLPRARLRCVVVRLTDSIRAFRLAEARLANATIGELPATLRGVLSASGKVGIPIALVTDCVWVVVFCHLMEAVQYRRN